MLNENEVNARLIWVGMTVHLGQSFWRCPPASRNLETWHVRGTHKQAHTTHNQRVPYDVRKSTGLTFTFNLLPNIVMTSWPAQFHIHPLYTYELNHVLITECKRLLMRGSFRALSPLLNAVEAIRLATIIYLKTGERMRMPTKGLMQFHKWISAY